MSNEVREALTVIILAITAVVLLFTGIGVLMSLENTHEIEMRKLEMEYHERQVTAEKRE